MKTRTHHWVLALLPLALVAALILSRDQTIAAPVVVPLTESAAQWPEPAKLISSQSPPVISARAFSSAYLAPDGRVEVLVAENGDLRWPIASISKLFTASVAGDYDPEQIVTLTQADLPENPDSGFFHAGEQFTVGELFLPLLLDSSNNAADILAAVIGHEPFLNKINNLTAQLNLTSTTLYNPSGLDPAERQSGVNYSSAHDLTLFSKWLLENKPEILATTRLIAAPVRTANGQFHHLAQSTDQLLLSEAWSSEIVGGKTGSTDLAGKNLLLILREPKTNGYLINLVLGADDHFVAMRELVNWVKTSYQF